MPDSNESGRSSNRAALIRREKRDPPGATIGKVKKLDDGSSGHDPVPATTQSHNAAASRSTNGGTNKKTTERHQQTTLPSSRPTTTTSQEGVVFSSGFKKEPASNRRDPATPTERQRLQHQHQLLGLSKEVEDRPRSKPILTFQQQVGNGYQRRLIIEDDDAQKETRPPVALRSEKKAPQENNGSVPPHHGPTITMIGAGHTVETMRSRHPLVQDDGNLSFRQHRAVRSRRGQEAGVAPNENIRDTADTHPLPDETFIGPNFKDQVNDAAPRRGGAARFRRGTKVGVTPNGNIRAATDTHPTTPLPPDELLVEPNFKDQVDDAAPRNGGVAIVVNAVDTAMQVRSTLEDQVRLETNHATAKTTTPADGRVGAHPSRRQPTRIQEDSLSTDTSTTAGPVIVAEAVDRDEERQQIRDEAQREMLHGIVEAEVVGAGDAQNDAGKAKSAKKKKFVFCGVYVLILLIVVVVIGLVVGLREKDSGFDPTPAPTTLAPMTQAPTTPTSSTPAPTTPAPTTDPSWTLLGILNGTQINDRFGGAVDISSNGHVVVVGAPFSTIYINATGYAEVYAVNANGTWIRRGQRLVGPPETNEKLFGQYVRLSADGDSLLIYSMPLLQYYTFGAQQQMWELKHTIVLFNDTNGGQVSNIDLSPDGQYAAVTSTTPFQLLLRVFDVTQDSLPEPDHFGPYYDWSLNALHPVALSNKKETMVVGGTINNRDGFVLMYRFGYNRWREPQNFTGDEESTERLGFHVSVSDDGRVIAVSDSISLGFSGRVHFLDFNDNSGKWMESRVTIAGGPREFWGKLSMLLSGDGSIVAVNSFDGSRRSQSLRFHRYDSIDNKWDEMDSIGYNDTSFNPLKCALSYTGTTAVCGSAEGLVKGKIGSAWIFEYA